ncbi:MAG: aminotransferase class V-fold PLP-dependent enzyme [Bryobacteraceae bacterium]|nr:aminotransferase class V-fold PLP-dependent enzyme [Bryobacteraceae bacterium]
MPTTRRGLFALLPPTWFAYTQSLQAADSTEAYWQLIKREFPLDDSLLYLNAANVCPASRLVLDRYQQFLRDFHANPSFQNREKYVPLEDRLRGKIASLLRVSADEIALTRNTSEGSNLVVRGLDLKPGDEVIITSHNHPSNNDSWKVRAKRDGFRVVSVDVPVPAVSAAALVESIRAAITSRTRVISVTHVTSTTGIRYPAKEIAALARERGLWMHLDGAQSFGAIDVNLGEIGCDSFSASAHKWSMGPLEAGLLYVRAARHKELWPAVVTAGWSETLVGARKFEVFGQRDDARLVSFEAAIDFLALMGMPKVEARLTALTGRLKQQFAAIDGASVRTNTDAALSGGVVKVDLPGRDLKPIYDRLWNEHRVAIAMTASGDSKGLRFSPHVYNTTAEIDRAVEALRQVARA